MDTLDPPQVKGAGAAAVAVMATAAAAAAAAVAASLSGGASGGASSSSGFSGLTHQAGVSSSSSSTSSTSTSHTSTSNLTGASGLKKTTSSKSSKAPPWLSFEAARALVRALALKSGKAWHDYSKSGKRPANIPSAPDRTYRDKGWVSMPDWLGYQGPDVAGTRMPRGEALSFDAARAFVRALKLSSQREWCEYSKSGKRPANIPSAPDRTYR